MQAPLFVRPPTEIEQQALVAGLRSADAFTLRRCQIILASARGLGGGEQSVRDAIHAFDQNGVTAHEVEERVCATFGCPLCDHLAILQEVA